MYKTVPHTAIIHLNMNKEKIGPYSTVHTLRQFVYEYLMACYRYMN